MRIPVNVVDANRYSVLDNFFALVTPATFIVNPFIFKVEIEKVP